MSKTRRSYTREFKADAVRLVEEEGYSMADAGRSLGINPNLLSRCMQELRLCGSLAQLLCRCLRRDGILENCGSV